LRLDHERKIDPDIFSTLIETICGIANSGPDADGFIYIGVADNERHAERIKDLDDVELLTVRHVFVVGIEREARVMGINMDSYQRMIEDVIRKSELTEPLKTMMATSIDIITYKGREVVRIRVPKQKVLSFVGNDAYLRIGSSTHKATGPQIAALSAKF
jgi:predicted HTH transcriptional regulator